MSRGRVTKPDGRVLRTLKSHVADVEQRAYGAVQNALIEHDNVASHYERKWGIDRLALLVDAELRERFWLQADKLNKAVRDNNAAQVEHEVQVSCRAYKKLDEVATASGAEPLSHEVWEAPLPSGGVLAVVRTDQEVSAVKNDVPERKVYSVEMVARVIDGWESEKVAAVLDAFPGAVIKEAKRIELDDEIPF